MLNVEAGNLFATATAAQAVITLAAQTGQRWSIGGIAWSYEGGTLSTDAELNVWLIDTSSSNLIWSIDINDDGAGFFIPSEPVKFPANHAVLFELVSGGAAVVGKINILGTKAV